MNWNTVKKFLVLIAAAALLTAGCGAVGDTQTGAPAAPPWAPTLAPLDKPSAVKVGMKQVVSDAGILIGMAKGYYQDLGIEIEPIQFSSGQEMINQLASGQLDVGAAVSSSGLFNAMARDISVKIVADKGINIPGEGYYRLVIRKELENTIQDYRDLKGKKIAIVGAASLDELSLDRVLAKGNLTLKDIDLQVIRSFPDMLVSFGNRSIDAAMLIEPFIAQGIKKGLLAAWKDPVEYDPHAQTAILVFGSGFIKNPETANRFMTAYVKALRDYNDAFFRDIHKDETIAILCKYSVVKEPHLYTAMYPTGLNPNGYLKKDGIALDLAWYKKNNLLKADVQLKDAVDESYVNFANRILGPYDGQS